MAENQQLPVYESQVPIVQGGAASTAPIYESLFKAASTIGTVVASSTAQQQKEALLAQKYMIDGDVSQHLQKELLQQMNNPSPHEGLEEFNTSAKTYLDKTLETTPNRLKALIRRDAIQYINNANSRLQGRVFKQQREDNLFDFYKQYNIRTNQISSLGAINATENDIELSRKKALDNNNMVHYAMQSGLIPGRVGAVLEEENYKNLYSSEYLGSYRNLKAKEDRDKFKTDFMKDKKADKYLSFKDKQILMNQFNAIDKQIASEHGINNATYNMFVNDLNFKALHGKPIDTKILADLAAARPEAFPKIAEDLKVNQLTWSAYSEHMNESVSEMKAAKEKYDIEEPKNYEQSIINKNISQMLGDRIKFAESDVVSFSLQNKAYQEVVGDPIKNKGLDARQTLISFEKSHGFSENQLSTLTNEESLLEVGKIKSLPILTSDGTLSQVEEISDYLEAFTPDVSYYAQRDLQRAGLPKSSVYLTRIYRASDDKLRAYVGDAAIAFSKLNKDDGGIKSYTEILGVHNTTPSQLMTTVYGDSTYQNFAESHYGSNGDLTETLTTRANLQQIFAAQLMSKGKDISTAVNLAGKALDAGIDYGSYHGNAYMFPTDLLQKNRVEGAIQYLDEIASKSDLKKPPRVYGRLPLSYKSPHLNTILLATGYARNTNDQLGIVLTDSVGNAIKTNDDKTFTFSFKDLADPSSEMSKQVDSFLSTREKTFYEKHRIKSSVRDMLVSNIANIVGREER